MSRHICFILDWYPTKTNNGCVFVKHLIYAIAEKGFKCTVIAPKIRFIQKEKVPYKRIEHTEGGNEITIYTPEYVHLGSKKQTIKLSMNNHFRSVMRVIKKENIRPDAVYGHFIYQCGLSAAKVGEKLGIPSFCACGENSLRFESSSEPYTTGLTYAGWKEILKKLSGIISVSSNNSRLLIENEFVPENIKMNVFPNGTDSKKFYIMDKTEARKKLGFDENAFIVVFTGAFTERKGIDKLNEALKHCENVYSVFLGDGEIKPNCDNILFCGKVNNSQVVNYLNAADAFVLPTKGEGCCNAIVEALVCGLPVISSDLSFNDDILNDDNSIRIDVDNVSELENAIKKLRDDIHLRNRLSAGAVASSDNLSISTRADRILRFMELL